MKKRKQNHSLAEKIARAIYDNDLKVIEEEIGADEINLVDRDGRSAIFQAVLAKSADIASVLVKKGADLNLRDNKGWSPLHCTAQNYLPQIAELLIENGADIECKDDNGNTPLWRAAFSSQGKGEMIKLLLSKGGDRNNENDSGISPLKLANTIANYDVKQFFE